MKKIKNIQIEARNDLDSDHLPIILILNDTPTEIIERKTLNYKKANWDKFSNYLNNNIIIDSKLHTPTHIDETVRNSLIQ